jgi:hypothetical protein
MKIHTILTTLAAAIFAGSASADIVNISGNGFSSIENTGAQFYATLEYTFDSDDDDEGTLVVTITNTSSSSVGGFLTGFLFDIATSDSDFEAELEGATNSNFDDTGSESANPFGNFDAGAALRANWNGGGNPSFGLGIGETGVFEFEIEADDASLLTAASFLGPDGDWLAVRFRGLNNGLSDKLLGNTVTVVPLPSAALAGLSMLGLGFGVRTIRRR